MKSSQLQYELELQEVKIKNIAKKNNLHMMLIYKIIQKLLPFIMLGITLSYHLKMTWFNI